MFGNVVNKKRLQELMKSDAIGISSFESSKMRLIHYPLSPVRIYSRGAMKQDRTIEKTMLHEFSQSNLKYVLEPNQYVLIEARERIIMKQSGIVGHFVVSSSFIERGLSLIAGRIEAPYGQNDEVVRFGVKNLLNEKILFTSTIKLHIYIL